MSESSCLSEYVQHLHARVRAQGSALPPCVDQLTPRERLDLIVEALPQLTSPNLIQAAGDGLLEDLLNEHASSLDADIANLLRTSERFRFAFACGKHASVDPALIEDWIAILQEIGTTKQAVRKRLWSKR